MLIAVPSARRLVLAAHRVRLLGTAIGVLSPTMTTIMIFMMMKMMVLGCCLSEFGIWDSGIRLDLVLYYTRLVCE